MTTALTSPPHGRDTSATDRIHRGRIVTGNRLLAEAAVRRLSSQRGSLLDDPNYGLPLVELLNQAATKDQIAAIPGRVRGELAKDTRLVEGSITVELIPIDVSGPAKSYEVRIGMEGDDGPFELVLSVNDLKVEILSLPEAAA